MKTNKKTAVPRLRFPEFQGSEEWKTKQLGEIATFSKGKGLPKSYIHKNGLLPCIHYGELFTRYSEVIDEVISYTNVEEDWVLSEKNDVLMPTSDVTPSGLAKASSINKDNVILGGDILIIKTDKKLINGEFLSRYIRFKELEVLRYVSGSTVYHLYASSINKLQLNFPSYKEQQKIANCLSSIDALIKAESEQLDASKSHKAGLLQQLFPSNGETVPKLRFGEFKEDKDWEERFFEDVLIIIDGDRGKNYPKQEDFTSEGYCLFLSARNVTKNGFVFEDVQFITKQKDKAMTKGKLRREDIVLTTRGTIGQFAYYSPFIMYDNIRINSGMVLLRVKPKKINSQYFYYFCQTPVLKRYIDNVAYGNAQQQLTVKGIKRFIISYPSLVEQEKIANFLSSLDELIQSQADKIQALKRHKQGLMQQLFPSSENPS